MRIAELGEFGLIERVAALAPPPNAKLIVGIGDDAAVWRDGDRVQLATTDALVEGVHFRRDTTSWRDLGWKALAVNLSDIAAMGGRPDYALITLGLPPDVAVADVEEFYRGLGEAAERWGVSLAGGDMARAPCVMVIGALIGSPGAGPDGAPAWLLRSAAQPGDAIAVTGSLGASRAGLEALASGHAGERVALLIAAHHRPQPRVEEGAALLALGVRCGMDISDGLFADLGHICRASGVAARVEAPLMPVHPALEALFPERALAWALTGGEDYELLIACPGPLLREAQRRGLPLSRVGAIEDGPAGRVTVVDAAGRPMDVGSGGWDHFREAARGSTGSP
ncbi:MAG TPA: thiamine-phosphate kinase [Dehalococcoidia bacterium]|nr:thiamine-phosphate kinase [Dehalococcoidia bacterium]